jgi:hypothetical protein
MAFQIDPNIPLQAGKVQFDPASILMQAQQNGAALEKHRFEMQKLREDYDLAKEKRAQEKKMQMGIASDLAGIQSGTPAQYAPMTYQQQPQRGQMPQGMTGVLMSEQGQQMPQPQVFGEDLMNGNYQLGGGEVTQQAVAGREPSYLEQLQIAAKRALQVGDVDSAFKYSQAMQQQRVAEREQNAPVGNPYPTYDAQGNFVGTRVMTKAGQEIPFGTQGTTIVKPDVLTAKDKANQLFEQQKLDRQLAMEQKKIDAKAKEDSPNHYFPDNGLTGNAFLASIPKQDKARLQAVIEGRAKFPSAMAIRRDPSMARLAEAVFRVDPDYDETRYATRQKASNDFTTGIQGKQLLAFGSAIKHLETLGSLVDAMANGDAVQVNRFSNLLQKQTGGVPVNNFEAAKGIVAKEIMKAIVAGGGGVEERQELSHLMDSAKSPEQLRGVIATYRELMTAQKENLIIQRDAAGLPRSTLPDYTKHSADDKGGQQSKQSDYKEYVLERGKAYKSGNYDLVRQMDSMAKQDGLIK